MPVLYRRGLLESTRVTMLSPDVISPNPDQPRRYFDPDGLYELAESIRVHGILKDTIYEELTYEEFIQYIDLVKGSVK